MVPTCILLVLLAITSRTLSQYMAGGDSYRADITFDERNDRFDVGAIINEQNRQFRDLPQKYEEDYRRRNDEALLEVLKDNRELSNRLKRRKNKRAFRRINDFAYHDRMESSNDEDANQQYETQLANFRSKHNRRNLQIIDLNDFLRKDKPKDERRHFFNFFNFNRRRKKAENVTIRNVVPTGSKRKARRQLHGLYEKTDLDLMKNAFPVKMRVTGFIKLPGFE